MHEQMDIIGIGHDTVIVSTVYGHGFIKRKFKRSHQAVKFAQHALKKGKRIISTYNSKEGSE